MVRKSILFFIFSLMAWSAPLQYLIRTTPAATIMETPSSVTTGPTGDDTSVLANIGFNFLFNNTIYTQVNISSNGMLNFGAADNTYTNSNLPSTTPQSIYPYWDDLYPLGGADGTITYGTIGTTPETQKFVVTWNAVSLFAKRNSKVTFQVVLYSNGDIRFRYPNVAGNVANGSSATIGVQETNPTGTANDYFNQYSYNSNSINFTTDILYASNLPTIWTSKSSCVVNDPINGTTNPKRIPGATIRYAVEIRNRGGGSSSSATVLDTINSIFNTATTPKVAAGACNCATGGGVNSGSVSGNDVTINFGSVAAGSFVTPTSECGYFEAVIK
jgi:hypothetical protein